MNGWESGIVIGAVLITLSVLFGSITTKTNSEAQYATQLELPIEFGLVSWALNFYRFGLILSAIAIIGILGFMDDEPSRIVGLFIPGFFAFLTGLGLIVDTKKKVKITEEMVSYKSIFGSFEIPLNRIQRVWTGNGLIIIDVGEKTRKVIPMMFQGNGQILATLQAKAQPVVSDNA